MATITNLYLDQGSDYSSIMTLTDSGGLPLNLTGFTVKSQMRKSYSSSTFHNFDCSVVDATSGKIKLAITAANSSLIKAGRWLYDVEITNTGSSAKKRVVEGVVIVSPQITQI